MVSTYYIGMYEHSTHQLSDSAYHAKAVYAVFELICVKKNVAKLAENVELV
jgi:uncharacterized membrane protein YiaA